MSKRSELSEQPHVTPNTALLQSAFTSHPASTPVSLAHLTVVSRTVWLGCTVGRKTLFRARMILRAAPSEEATSCTSGPNSQRATSKISGSTSCRMLGPLKVEFRKWISPVRLRDDSRPPFALLSSNVVRSTLTVSEQPRSASAAFTVVPSTLRLRPAEAELSENMHRSSTDGESKSEHPPPTIRAALRIKLTASRFTVDRPAAIPPPFEPRAELSPSDVGP